MLSISKRPLIPLLLLLCTVWACKKRPIGKEDGETMEDAPKAVDSAEAPFSPKALELAPFSFNLKVRAETPEEKRRIKLRMRMHPDSLIWASFAPAMGMEMGRALLSDDSLRFIDRMNKKAYNGDPSYLNELLGMEMDRRTFQGILLARPPLIWNRGFLVYEQEEDTVHFRPIMDDSLSGLLPLEDLDDPMDSVNIPFTENKRMEVERYIKEEGDPGPIPYIWGVQYSAGNDVRMARFVLLELGKERIMEVRYPERQDLEGELIPELVRIRVRSPKGISTFELEISGPKSSSELKFPFNVPDSYEPIRP